MRYINKKKIRKILSIVLSVITTYILILSPIEVLAEESSGALESTAASEAGSSQSQSSSAEGETTTVEPTEPTIDFEEMLSAFPESYREPLRKLHEAHPSWAFEAYYPSITWADLVYKQYYGSISLNVTSTGNMQIAGIDSTWYKTPTSWLSFDVAGAFNWTTNSFVNLAGSGWVKASKEALCYIMDPRNWLTENNVFMFQKQSYLSNISEAQIYKALVKMLDNTFMDCDYATLVDNDGNVINYATAFLKIGKETNTSPLHICSKIISEQGRGTWNGTKYVPTGVHAKGTVTSDGKNFSVATEGTKETIYYNYFNYQATGSNTQQIINSGGVYAKNHGWTTPYKSLLGGAQLFGKSYVNKGQDTYYTQKYDIVLANGYFHQYMQAILAPVSDGYNIKKAYANLDALDSPFVFKIPVYTDNAFTSTTNPKPSAEKGTANPNYKLSGIGVTGTTYGNEKQTYALTPSFNLDTLEYNIIVPYEVPKITISATSYASTSTITGIGTFNVAVGDNTFNVTCTSAYGPARTYKVNVYRIEGSTYLSALSTSAGGFETAFDKEQQEYRIIVENSVTEISFNCKAESSIASVELIKDEHATVIAGGVTETQSLAEGNNVFLVRVYPIESERAIYRTYKINVIRYTDVKYSASTLQFRDDFLNGFSIGETIESVQARFNIENGSVKFMAKDGKTVKAMTDAIATGDICAIYDLNGYEFKRYQVVVYGDVNGDSKVDLFDFSYVKVYYLKNRGLEGIGLVAADVSTTVEGFDLFDIAAIKNYILRGKAIIQTKPVVEAEEPTPEETTPAETTPAETTPAETTPVETTPAETTPVETTTPIETTSGETVETTAE